ncbi:cupredoxin domain-containing protein [Sinomonas sp. ASV486]|uniref:cupredoxin domain-containing protein n=1 Tax=Sinomonas sp. ASV486 TaxID=3051170 RepID=UPI0027DC6454|nr:cupredoxin domain-containing protein [Sinomonas sp. ASV486]MDQ4490042.1 cupredoxin domain-containing protein [Sinomonas sp. ASV486]
MARPKTFQTLLLASGLILTVGACSPPAGPTPSPSSTMTMDMGSSSQATIHVKDFAFTGANSAAAGTRISVMNMDGEAHSVTADDGSFDVTVQPGKTLDFTVPAKPGTYAYHCKFHADMHGTLTVR